LVEQTGILRLSFIAFRRMGRLARCCNSSVTFPHSFHRPPTYADIPAPVTLGEVLSRIEEMEGMLWQFARGRWGELVRRRYGPLRRTYGFFETSALLAGEHVRRFNATNL